MKVARAMVELVRAMTEVAWAMFEVARAMMGHDGKWEAASTSGGGVRRQSRSVTWLPPGRWEVLLDSRVRTASMTGPPASSSGRTWR